MLACISPASNSVRETTRSVNFAAAATHIDSNAHIVKELQYMEESSRLRKQKLEERAKALEAASLKLSEDEKNKIELSKQKIDEPDEKGRFRLKTKFGEVDFCLLGPENAPRGTAILLSLTYFSIQHIMEISPVLHTLERIKKHCS